MILKSFPFKTILAIGGAAFLLGGCQKDLPTGDGTFVPQPEKKITLNDVQERKLQDMITRVPKVAYYDEANNRLINLNLENRDWSFTSPPDGWQFDDADDNGVIFVEDIDGGTIVFSGTAGANTGGGSVVAGNSALDIDVAICLSAQEVGEDGGFVDLFDTGFGFAEFAVVIGIAGDFEELANADTESEDFDPFEFFHGFAEYFVIADEIGGNHEVFDWMDAEEGGDDYDDMAAAFLMDFQNFALYFSVDGDINVSGGQMSFNGHYLAIEDLFLDYLEGGDDSDPEVSVVSGFGTMGCN